MENLGFRMVVLLIALAIYGFAWLGIWCMWMNEKENGKDGC